MVLEPENNGGEIFIPDCGHELRFCYIMEKSPVYAEVIKKRWEKLTGQKGVKI